MVKALALAGKFDEARGVIEAINPYKAGSDVKALALGS